MLSHIINEHIVTAGEATAKSASIPLSFLGKPISRKIIAIEVETTGKTWGKWEIIIDGKISVHIGRMLPYATGYYGFGVDRFTRETPFESRVDCYFYDTIAAGDVIHVHFLWEER